MATHAISISTADIATPSRPAGPCAAGRAKPQKVPAMKLAIIATKVIAVGPGRLNPSDNFM